VSAARALGAATVLAVAVAAPAAAVDTAQSLAETLCDRTIHVYYGIGNQIEYLSPSGESFFWYPGEDEIITGTWRTLESVTGEPPLARLHHRGVLP